MVVTDAQFSGLSGTVDTLIEDVFDNSKYILGLPSIIDFDALQAYNAQQFNNINTVLDSIQETQDILISYITNLKQNHGALEVLFDVHTGSAVFALSGLATSGAHN